MKNSAQFPATVYKIQTLVDGGLRVTLDLPENAIESAAWLMECKRQEKPLKVIVSVLPGLKNGKKQTQRRAAIGPLEMVGR